MKQAVLFLLLGVFLVSFSGCSTIQGAAKGAAKGASEGFSQDWEKAKKLDGWLREHAW